MKAGFWVTAAVAATLLASGTARAEGLQGRFSVAVQVGTETQLGGDFVKGTSGTLYDKPVTIDTKRYKDVYSPDWRFQGLVGYGVGSQVEAFVRGSYYKADSPGVEVGQMDGKTLYAYFTPYEEWGIEGGVRYYLSARTRLKSYVAPVVGARFLERVVVDLYAPDAGTSVRNLPYLEAGTVAVLGMDIGFSFDLGDHAYVGVDTGVRYQLKPTPYPPPSGLPGFNDADGRWTAPVVAALGVRF
jgi:hypothetical protein